MDDKIKINLRIGGNNFTVAISREHEEIVRRAAKEVESRFNLLMNQYGNLSKERAIAKIAYDFALENLRLQEQHDTEPYDQKITALTKEIEDCF
jgi:cell division protein ZapA